MLPPFLVYYVLLAYIAYTSCMTSSLEWVSAEWALLYGFIRFSAAYFARVHAVNGPVSQVEGIPLVPTIVAYVRRLAV